MDRRIFFFNREAERITGYGRSEVLGRDCHEVFGAPFCGGRCSFCQSPPDLAPVNDYPLNITTRSGEPRRIEMRVTCMRDDEGRLSGVLAAFKDVTDVLRLQMRAGELTSFGSLIGHDSRMLAVFKQIRDAAGYDYPVHVSGETGTGK
nr:PAS domain-containing protein [Desulfobacterales bacterium]